MTVRLPDVPGTITDLRVQHLDVVAGTATATWSAPDDGGSAVQYHWVTVTDETTGQGHVQAPVYDDTAYPLHDLTPGHVYRVAVTSTNTMGEAAAAVTVFTVAGAPGQVTALQTSANRLARTVTAAWAAPTQTGGADIQHYYVRLVGGDWLQLSGATTSYTFTGVATGDHVVEVRADNGAVDDDGEPLASTTTSPVTMLSTPVAPGAVGGLKIATDAAHGRVTLTWSAPADDGGAAVTDYVVAVGSRSLTAPGTTLTVSSLALGTSYRISRRCAQRSRHQCDQRADAAADHRSGRAADRRREGGPQGWRDDRDLRVVTVGGDRR